MIEPEILRERPFLAANAFNLIFGCCLGALTLVPLYAVSIYGMSTFESGAIITPRSVGLIMASTVTSFSLVRWGYRRPMLIGTIVIISCFVILAMETAVFNILSYQVGSTVLLLVVMGMEGLSEGVAIPAANNACIELMPHRVATH